MSELSVTEYEVLKAHAKKYLKARHEFILDTNKLPELAGNDNIVGRIGELIAIHFLRSNGRNVKKNLNSVEKGYDLLADDKKISVKIITAENKSGKTTKVKQPWDEFILIKLNSSYEVECLGIINKEQFKIAYDAKSIKTKTPKADIKMLSINGLFSKYGKRYNGKDVAHYL